MTRLSTTRRSTNSPSKSDILSTKQEVFASEVANGATHTDAALKAGFGATYAYGLMKKPQIRARVSELIELRRADSASGSIASRNWIEAQIVTIICEAMRTEPAQVTGEGPNPAAGRKPDYPLALTALMNLAKLKGFVVDRKQVDKRSANLPTRSGPELAAMLEREMELLSPDQRSRIRELSAIEGRSRKRLPSPSAGSEI